MEEKKQSLNTNEVKLFTFLEQSIASRVGKRGLMYESPEGVSAKWKKKRRRRKGKVEREWGLRATRGRQEAKRCRRRRHQSFVVLVFHSILFIFRR